MVISSPERASAGEKDSITIGSVYCRSKRVDAVMPAPVTMVTGPTSGPSTGTVRRISLRGPAATVVMSVTVTPPAKRTSLTVSRLLPMMRSSPPRITGLGAMAARATVPEYWSVSSLF